MKDQVEINKELKACSINKKAKLAAIVVEQQAKLSAVCDEWGKEIEGIYCQNSKAMDRYVVSSDRVGNTRAMSLSDAMAEKSRLVYSYPDQAFVINELELTDEGLIIEGELVSKAVVAEVIEDGMRNE